LPLDKVTAMKQPKNFHHGDKTMYVTARKSKFLDSVLSKPKD